VSAQSITHAVIRNSGKLEIAIEQPTFKADPLHRKRVFAHAIYNLASAPQKTSKGNKGFSHSPKILLWSVHQKKQTLNSGGAGGKSKKCTRTCL
jgi:hypothetical protein